MWDCGERGSLARWRKAVVSVAGLGEPSRSCVPAGPARLQEAAAVSAVSLTANEFPGEEAAACVFEWVFGCVSEGQRLHGRQERGRTENRTQPPGCSGKPCTRFQGRTTGSAAFTTLSSSCHLGCTRKPQARQESLIKMLQLHYKIAQRVWWRLSSSELYFLCIRKQQQNDPITLKSYEYLCIL